MRVALSEADGPRDSPDIDGQTRAQKLCFLLLEPCLHRPSSGGLLPKSSLREQFSLCATGCADQAVASRRWRP